MATTLAASVSAPGYDDPLTFDLEDVASLLAAIAVVYTDAMEDSKRGVAVALAPLGPVQLLEAPRLADAALMSDLTRAPPQG